MELWHDEQGMKMLEFRDLADFREKTGRRKITKLRMGRGFAGGSPWASSQTRRRGRLEEVGRMRDWLDLAAHEVEARSSSSRSRLDRGKGGCAGEAVRRSGMRQHGGGTGRSDGGKPDPGDGA